MWVRFRNKIIGAFYRGFLKKIFFQIDPEKVHDQAMRFGIFLGAHRITRALTRRVFFYAHPALEQTILGLRFANPVGLAAGFDKNGRLVQILPAVGFGFAEIGSVTGEPCAGNPKPRLWRLPSSQSLAVFYGLKNDGAEVVVAPLRGSQHPIPFGVNIAKTNSPTTVEIAAGIRDYAKALRAAQTVSDYITVNISCPNTFGGEPFTSPESLDQLLTELDRWPDGGPRFLKMPADISSAEIAALVAVANRHRVDGYICSNLTKDRTNPAITDSAVPEQGGLSGKVVSERANNLIAEIYRLTAGQKVIIGVGGIFSAADAYEKIKLGASLVQLITGMIYQGPQLISEINVGLVRLLRADGYENISEAVGKGI